MREARLRVIICLTDCGAMAFWPVILLIRGAACAAEAIDVDSRSSTMGESGQGVGREGC